MVFNVPAQLPIFSNVTEGIRRLSASEASFLQNKKEFGLSCRKFGGFVSRFLTNLLDSISAGASRTQLFRFPFSCK